MGELRKLQIFYAQHNDIEELPDFDGCDNIEELFFGNNFIKVCVCCFLITIFLLKQFYSQEIKADFCESLPQLKILDLRDNKIANIAEEVVMLQQLIRLDLTNNEISRFARKTKTLSTTNYHNLSLPNTLSLLTHLQNLQLEGNSLKQIRTDVIKGGTGRILRFLREKMDDAELGKTANTEKQPQKKEAFPHKHQMYSIKALNLSMKDLTMVPDEVFQDARSAEVHGVDLSRNKLNCVPDGCVFVVKTCLN